MVLTMEVINMYEKIKRNWSHPEKILIKLGQKSKLVSDRLYLRAYFYNVFGEKLDLEDPKTFNEKLQWLKLYNRKPEYTTMVDKFKVREYIAKKIGKEYLIPLLGVWDSPDEIDFDALPDKFVLKCNHNSGLGMCICKDKSKLNIENVKSELKKVWLRIIILLDVNGHIKMFLEELLLKNTWKMQQLKN